MLIFKCIFLTNLYDDNNLTIELCIFFFDTETTGLPKNWKAPVTDLNNWPRLVQLAYLCCDNDGNEISSGDFIIKPEGFSIPAQVSKIHGITNESALAV